MTDLPSYNPRPQVKRKTARKSHSGMQARIENTKRLIAEFRTRELTRKDVMAFFEFSKNGAGRYVKDLLEGGIIEIARLTAPTTYSPGLPVYWQTADDATIAAFMVSISIPTGNIVKAKKVKVDTSRNLHVMHDDAYFKVKMHRAPVAADPLGLPADFFRSRADDGEKLPRHAMPVIPPKPSGFPVPGQVRFELGVAA